MKKLLFATLFIAHVYGSEGMTINLSDKTTIQLDIKKHDCKLATYIVWFLEPIKNSPTKDLFLKTLYNDGFLNKNDYLKNIESKTEGTWCFASDCKEYNGDIFMKNLDSKRYDQGKVIKILNGLNKLKNENKLSSSFSGLSNTLRNLFLKGTFTRSDYKPKIN